MNKTETQAENTELSRLRWQCRRGMLELDLFLQGFLDKSYNDLTPKQQQTFELLLETPDQMLLDYLMGRVIPYDKEIADVAKQIRLAAGPGA
ncbi:Succinate dehydrogenase flavin-adding protein, antitoxin of CptAB toxin-antitoxin [hydrothermal vent metagenome]|uniref:Succinate dehydrogenase flavin-adding protein, antitoxin of CptAB toxin-antitoxin n=1 Tax=hydrothermal vent metagenome TaxID=652676 RepID=A0A3B0ZVY5_9ZZZZ